MKISRVPDLYSFIPLKFWRGVTLQRFLSLSIHFLWIPFPPLACISSALYLFFFFSLSQFFCAVARKLIFSSPGFYPPNWSNRVPALPPPLSLLPVPQPFFAVTRCQARVVGLVSSGVRLSSSPSPTAMGRLTTFRVGGKLTSFSFLAPTTKPEMYFPKCSIDSPLFPQITTACSSLAP